MGGPVGGGGAPVGGGGASSGNIRNFCGDCGTRNGRFVGVVELGSWCPYRCSSGLPLLLSGEVSLSSRFRTDFLVLRTNGFPVGVIEVKKPGKQVLIILT